MKFFSLTVATSLFLTAFAAEGPKIEQVVDDPAVAIFQWKVPSGVKAGETFGMRIAQGLKFEPGWEKLDSEGKVFANCELNEDALGLTCTTTDVALQNEGRGFIVATRIR